MFDERLISKHHVEQSVLEYLLLQPKHHPARSAFLIWDGKRLPAKILLRIAFRIATGQEPSAEQLTGGRASVSILENLGFKTLYDKKPSTTRPSRRVDRRNAFHQALMQRYGDVHREHRFPGVSVPDLKRRDLMDKDLHSILEDIETARGNRISGQKGRLLSCDYFISSIKTVLEFDERQHFTSLRAVSLQNYPRHAQLGFDAQRWIGLSEKIRAGDNSPIFRDEQRAFYDAIRDLTIPRMDGFRPVIRVFEEDVAWEKIISDKQAQEKAVAALMASDAR